MGLREKRAAAAFERDRFPGLLAEIRAAAGLDLTFEVAWNEIAREGCAEWADVAFSSNFFVPLRKAFEAICIDDLGREAVKTGIKGVKVTSQREWSALEVTLVDGVVHLDADPNYNHDESCVEDYTRKIVDVLEKAL